MLIQEQMELQRKLEILSDAAKYDVSCTSSGVEKGRRGCWGTRCRQDSATVLRLTGGVSLF